MSPPPSTPASPNSPPPGNPPAAPVALADSPENKAALPVIFQILGADLTAKGLKDGVPHLPDAVKPQPLAIKPEGPKGEIKRVSYKMHQRVSDYGASYFVTDGQQRSWYVEFLRHDSGDAMPRSEAIALAQKIANPPPDAVLEVSDYDTQAGIPVFVARWEHVVNNVPVEDDYLQVLINGKTKKAFAFHRRWHTVDPKPGLR